MGGTKGGRAAIGVLRLSLWSVTGAAALACSSGGEQEAGRSTEPVVFGNISQVEFESGTSAQQEWATAVGILMPTAKINRAGKTCPDKTQVSDACTAVLSTFSKTLCTGEDFATQSEIGPSCTAFMIRNDAGQPAVFATAGHCLLPQGDCPKESVVLKWRRALPNFAGGNPNVLEQHIYQCTRVLAHGGTTNPIVTDPGDWAVFEVDRHVTGGGVTGGPLTPEREALTISATGPVPGGKGTTIGHPVGVPTKIDPEIVLGSLSTARGPGTFYAFLDAVEGQSGSPILNDAGEVVGILTEAKGPVKDPALACSRQCFPPGQGPVICDPLTGLSANDPNAYATVGVSIAQIPSQFRNTAEHVMILLDQTGSMTLAGTAAGKTRWDDAVSAAGQWLQVDRLTAGFVERAYSVWTFRDDTPFGGSQTGLKQIWPLPSSADCAQFESSTGFCVLPRDTSFDPLQYDALQARLETLRTSEKPIVGPVTPLAHSLCSGLETLRAIPGQKRIIVESDGGENGTALSDGCFGQPSAEFGDWSVDLSLRALADWGMTLDSWQAKVVRRATRLGLPLAGSVASPLTADDWFSFDLVWNVDVHFGVQLPNTALRMAAAARPVEGVAGGSVQRAAAPASLAASDPLSIAGPELSLFKNLGGANPKSTFHSYTPSDAVFGIEHPVAGDVDNDGCVNQADLCLLMQDDVWLHRAVAPATQAIRADLDRDGWTNAADLALLTNHWGNGCSSAPAQPNFDAAVHACRVSFGSRWLSFEDPMRPWRVGIGSVQLSTTQSAASDSLSALQVNGCQYAAIDSPLFNSNELAPGAHLALDVRLPTLQQNPYWLGDVQLFLTVPGANVNNVWLGLQPLTGLTTESWHSLTFDLPASVRAALASAHAGVQLRIALNTGNCLAPVLIDHVRVEN